MGSWLNSDGLYIKYGVTEGETGTGGAYTTYGPERVMEFKTKAFTEYPFGSTIYILDYNVIAPKAFWLWAELEVVVVPTSLGSPTLDFGLIKTDQTTEGDYDGFIAAAAMTAFDGEIGVRRTYRCEATDSVPTPVAGGALLGTSTTYTAYPCIRVNTASYTAGQVFLRLGYRFLS